MFFKKIVNWILLFTVVLLCGLVQVHAETIESKILENYYIKDNVIEEQTPFLYYEDSINAKFLYKMKYENEYISSQNYYTQEYLYEDFFVISKIKWNRIKNLVYFGYDYNDHQDIKWYILTQYIIYQELGYDITIVNSENIDFKILFESEYNELIELVEKHESLPSFYKDGDTINFNYGEKYLLDNSIEEAFYFALTSPLKLIIEANQKFIVGKYPKEAAIHWETKVNDKTKNVVYYNKDTSFITRGGPVVYIDKINVNIHGGKIKIVNINEEGVGISNALFSLYNSSDEKILEMITNDLGIAETDYIPKDDYYLLQEKTTEDYVLFEEPVKIDFVDYGITEVNLTSKKPVGKVKINLGYRYLNSSELIFEANAEFGIYKEGILLKSGFTDNLGYLEFDLPQGEYVLKQISSSLNFELQDDVLFKINSNEVLEFKFYNEKEQEVIKEDNVTKEEVVSQEKEEYIILEVPSTGLYIRPVFVIGAIIFMILGIILYVKKK